MLPWPLLLRLAVQRLGWTPAAFWAATPYELSSALGLSGETRPIDRAALDALLLRHPDAGSDASVQGETT